MPSTMYSDTDSCPHPNGQPPDSRAAARRSDLKQRIANELFTLHEYVLAADPHSLGELLNTVVEQLDRTITKLERIRKQTS
jgi:hypothetical protein